jgi:hypothetical protein
VGEHPHHKSRRIAAIKEQFESVSTWQVRGRREVGRGITHSKMQNAAGGSVRDPRRLLLDDLVGDMAFLACGRLAENARLATVPVSTRGTISSD